MAALRPFCGQCGGRIEWIHEDEDRPYWRHLDLVDLEEPHGAYRDEVAAAPESSEKPGVPDATDSWP